MSVFLANNKHSKFNVQKELLKMPIVLISLRIFTVCYENTVAHTVVWTPVLMNYCNNASLGTVESSVDPCAKRCNCVTYTSVWTLVFFNHCQLLESYCNSV